MSYTLYMLRKFLLICAFLTLSLSAFASGYSSVIEDLPLMPGMTEQSADAVIFDKPAGRIVQTSVSTTATANAVDVFYAETLPSLGWHKISPSVFVREKEELKLDFEQKAGATVVHFTLTPHSEGK